MIHPPGGAGQIFDHQQDSSMRNSREEQRCTYSCLMALKRARMSIVACQLPGGAGLAAIDCMILCCRTRAWLLPLLFMGGPNCGMAAWFDNCWLPGCAIMFAKPAWFMAVEEPRKWVGDFDYTQQDCCQTNWPARCGLPTLPLSCTRNRPQKVVWGKLSR